MSYIQDKLDAFRTKVKDIIENPRKCTKEDIDIIVNLHKQSLTDHHNHIVEKILHYYQENILYIGNEVPESLARISDMDRYVMLGLPSDIQKILRDTNK